MPPADTTSRPDGHDDQMFPSLHEQTPIDWNMQVLESIQEAQFAVDSSWNICYVNQRASLAFQQQPEALIGHVFWETFPELIGSELEQFYRLAMSTGQAAHRQHFSQKTQCWYDVHAYPVTHGLVVTFHDTTNYKRLEVEQHIQAQRRRMLAEADDAQFFAEVQPNYQLILDNLAHRMSEVFGDMCTISILSDDEKHLELTSASGPDPMLIKLVRDTQAQGPARIDISPLAERIVREGKPILLSKLTPQQAAAVLRPEFQQAIGNSQIHSVIVLPLRAQGRTIGIFALLRLSENLPSFTEDDLAFVQLLANRAALMVTYARLIQAMQHELEERTRAEEARRQSEAQYQGIIASAMDAIISVNNDLRIVVFNTAAEQMFQCQAADIIGESLDKLLPVLVQPHHASYIRQFGQTGVTNRSMRSPGVLTARRWNGEEFPIEATISQTAVWGKPIYTAIIRDITQRKQLERQLTQAQKMESIGRLAGGIAHDFNNLLTAIMSYSELIAESLSSTHRNYNDIKEIQRASTRASALTRQLLAFSRQQVLEPKRTDMNEVVRDIEKLLKRTIGDDITLVTALAPQPLRIFADPNQIGQVLLNMAINARDAMPEGGTLTLETASVELDASYQFIRHSEITPGHYAVLSVTDTGIGMDLSTQSLIFEPFFTTKEQGKGTGLGLATAYGIVRQSNGYIWVYSELGLGTTFKIYMPLTLADEQSSLLEQPVAEEEHHHKDVSLSQPRFTLLVVEDDTIVRDILIRTLSNAGYAVLFAENGQDALTLLETQTNWPDLIVTDMVMPTIGGHQLITTIRESHPQIKIIGMSGYNDLGMTYQSISVLCDAFLQKPFTAKMLLREVGEVLTKPID